MEKPTFFTFDIFGTVLNWFDGLRGSLAYSGKALDSSTFDRIIDHQGLMEQKQYKAYSQIAAASLTDVMGLDSPTALEIGMTLGRWPLFADSSEGMKRLMGIAPCAAMSNSDRVHGENIQKQLGFNLSHWFCAEDFRVYKPNPAFWNKVSAQLGVPFSRNWWHVSAYADYDLEVARELGLTCVFISREHQRRGFSHIQANDLLQLAQIASSITE